MSDLSSLKHTFEQIQLADAYTRNIVFGYIRGISSDFAFRIPKIIYELCVSFYYAGEHFAYRGYDMFIDSEDDKKSLRTYNNIIEMTSDDTWNTVHGQVTVDTKLKINYIYQWLFKIKTSYATSIGFGVSTDYDVMDDAFWICTNSKYYSFTASINTAQKLSLLSSASSSWITYDRSLCDEDEIKLVFNVKKKTLECIINEDQKENNKKSSPQIIVHNIDTNKLKYHLSISMCGRYKVRLLDFKRINNDEIELNQSNKTKLDIISDSKHYGDIEIGILSKSMRDIVGNDNSDDENDTNCFEEGDILTLKNIIYDYQSIKSISSRKQIILDFAKKEIIKKNDTKNNTKNAEFTAIEEVYGLIEWIVLLVIRDRYKGNVIFTQSYFKDVTEFVEWIFYDEHNMDSNPWPIQQFAQKFDDWLSRVTDGR